MPIALLNTFLTITLKDLANRLSLHLSDLVGDHQKSYIIVRNILEGVVVM